MVNQISHILKIENLTTGYGKKKVINEISFEVSYGEIVVLIGHNGAGKSTILKTIFGLLPIWSGNIFFDGNRIQKLSPKASIERGIIYAPQGNRIFADLTVLENLKIGGAKLQNEIAFKEELEKILSIFPSLIDKLSQRAGTLSGGEKQMLALANALILSPKLLLLDEPSLGLSPSLTTSVFKTIQEINSSKGLSIIIVEQKVRQVMSIAHKICVLRNGTISFWGAANSLDEDNLMKVFL